MVELTYDVLEAMEDAQKERILDAKREGETAPTGRGFGAIAVSDGLLVTNGDWIFCFEDVDNPRLAKKLISESKYPLLKLKEAEHWEEGMAALKGAARLPITKDILSKTAVSYRTSRGQVYYMSLYYCELMYKIVKNPSLSICVPKDKNTEARMFMIFEGRILRGLISNRLVP